MKKVAIVCAAGKAGKLIADEAVGRGLDVTAVVRDKNKVTNKNVKVIEKDLFALTADDLKGFDVVIDAFGAWTEDTIPFIPKAVSALCECVKNTDTRLLIVGGAGSLYVDPDHKTMLIDTPDFPDSFKPLAAAHNEALASLRTRNDVRWTYISPAGDFQADGARTGSYKLGGEELTLSAKGESVISYADYAIAMIDEAISGHNIKKRISVVQK